MTAAVRMPSQVHEALVAHARFAYPEEACGLVAGTGSGDLEMAFCLTNRERSPYRFTVDPTEHYRSLQFAERRGWDLVGVFHSHPSSAAHPSAIDIAGALDPEWVYLLVSLQRPEAPDVRAYEIRDGVASERPIVRGAP